MYVSRGKAVAFLTIRSDELEPEVDGFCKSTSDTGTADDLIDISLAGPMAEWRAFGNEDDFESFLAEHAGQLDIYRAGELARHRMAREFDDGARAPSSALAEERQRNVWAWLADRCETVAKELDGLWPAVEAVADALLRERRLSGEDVERICREAGRR